MKNRSRDEIIAQILEVARGGTTKSKIVYKVFLSYRQAKAYVIMLEQKGLLAHDETNATFRTTPKGFQFMDMHNRLYEILGLATVDGIQEGIQERLPTVI